MRVNIKEFLSGCGLKENIYPGKRVVQKLPQTGEFKSHCVVYDWRAPDTFRLEIKAGLSGKDLQPKELKKYPVSFQAPTYVEMAVQEGAEEGNGEEEETGSQGSAGGGGGKGFKQTTNAFAAFSKVVEGRVPELGEVKKLVLMGKDIAKAAMATVLESIKEQIRNMCIHPVNILAQVNTVKVTVVTPGGGLQATGRETVTYKYKGNEMFGITGP
jgi:hypothetical protein